MVDKQEFDINQMQFCLKDSASNQFFRNFRKTKRFSFNHFKFIKGTETVFSSTPNFMNAVQWRIWVPFEVLENKGPFARKLGILMFDTVRNTIVHVDVETGLSVIQANLKIFESGKNGKIKNKPGR